jgi:hypothetical protein
MKHREHKASILEIEEFDDMISQQIIIDQFLALSICTEDAINANLLVGVCQ